MDVVKSLAIQSPMMIASIVLVIAALLKMGREKGAILVLLGAIGLCLMTLLTPIIYSGIMPKVMEEIDMDNVENIYLAIGLISNLLWAGTLALIAMGTFLRSPADAQPSPFGSQPN